MRLAAAPVERRRHVTAGILTLIIEAIVLALMLMQNDMVRSVVAEDVLKTFDILPPPPPIVTVRPKPAQSYRPEGAASPPNLRSKATPIVAPPPIMPVKPPPIVAAKVAGTGFEATQGAAPVAGPGTGAGGIGSGTGSGGAGDGDGDGETGPVWRKGRLKDSDYPHGASAAGVEGTVGVRYLVGVDGRVSRCDVTRSSGNAELDATTCRLIRERFRFEPSRDREGRPVPAYIVEKHSWAMRTAPDQGDDDEPGSVEQ